MCVICFVSPFILSFTSPLLSSTSASVFYLLFFSAFSSHCFKVVIVFVFYSCTLFFIWSSIELYFSPCLIWYASFCDMLIVLTRLVFTALQGCYSVFFFIFFFCLFSFLGPVFLLKPPFPVIFIPFSFIHLLVNCSHSSNLHITKITHGFSFYFILLF